MIGRGGGGDLIHLSSKLFGTIATEEVQGDLNLWSNACVAESLISTLILISLSFNKLNFNKLNFNKVKFKFKIAEWAIVIGQWISEFFYLKVLVGVGLGRENPGWNV